MVKVIVRGAASENDVKAAAAAGAHAVAFVVESKGDPANLDITLAMEHARMAPPLLPIILATATKDEKRLRRAIGSLHPHAVEFDHELDPMVLAELQIAFPELKWFARLHPSAYEPFHDAADALVLTDLENAADVVVATRSRVVVDGLADDADLAAVVRDVQPFALVVPPARVKEAVAAVGGN